MKHYVAVFDENSGRLEVKEAKRLTVRGSIRQAPPVPHGDEDEDVPMTNYSTRAALTEAFGTKKSKKAVQSVAENRQLAQGGEGAVIAEAMISNIAREDEEESTFAQSQLLARSNKPLPQPDLGTGDVHEVYHLNALVFPSPADATLKLMHTGTWTARLKAKKEIPDLRSRFVANRVGYLGLALLASAEGTNDPKLLKQFQLLRYIDLLLQIQKYLSKQPRHGRINTPDKWPAKTMTDGTPPSILMPILKRFFPDMRPNTHSMTLLRATILALALHILPPSLQTKPGTLATEPTDLALDMAIEASEARKLYRELGCKVEGATDKELTIWGLEKIKKKKDESGQSPKAPQLAKLALPLEFPKVSRGKVPRR